MRRNRMAQMEAFQPTILVALTREAPTLCLLMLGMQQICRAKVSPEVAYPMRLMLMLASHRGLWAAALVDRRMLPIGLVWVSMVMKVGRRLPCMVQTRVIRSRSLVGARRMTEVGNSLAVTVTLRKLVAGPGMLMVTLGVLMPMGVVSRPGTVLSPLAVRILTVLAVAPMLMLVGTGLTVMHLRGTSAVVTLTDVVWMLMVITIRPRMMLVRITKPTTIGQAAIAARTASAIAV